MEPTLKPESFTFSGSGGEYFRIWIVNLCLSLITLGLYSPWAKVRRTQYFYRHTAVAGSHFDYHGNPLAILKGRLIAGVLFGAYFTAQHFNPKFGLVVFALLIAVMPWLLVRSFCFRMHNTSYRGLRFAFHGKTAEAYVNFLLLPLVSYLSLGLFWPWAHQRITRFIRNNIGYGNGHFTFQCTTGAFYKIYLALLGLTLIAIALAIGLSVLLVKNFLATMHIIQLDQNQAIAVGFIMMIVLYLELFFISPYLMSRLQNLIWNHTALESLYFSSRLQARKLFNIMLVNLLLTIFTLGLFKPFADIRMFRYRIEQLTLLSNADLDTFISEQQPDVSAVGEETSDFFDMDSAL